MIYKNGVFLTKNNPLDLSSSGIPIAGASYIAYDLGSLKTALGGMLAGKTIEIEFSDGIPK